MFLTIAGLFFNCKLFPGLIYRLVNPRVVFLIFVSGKIVITGAKKETDLSVALTKLYPVLLEFKKVHTAGAFDTIAPASQGNGKVIRSSAEKRMEEV
jgi:transcription initiation factor TFIID TATA-box-binding protein